MISFLAGYIQYMKIKKYRIFKNSSETKAKNGLHTHTHTHAQPSIQK